MTWFVAHVVMSVRFKDGGQDRFPVWENIILIEARTESEAWEKAIVRGKEDAGDSNNTFTWDGRAAEWIYSGIRKIVISDYLGARPESGTEVTYSEFEVATAEDLESLVAGRSVKVVYVAEASDEEPSSG